MELRTGQLLSEETRSRAVEALHALVAADRIDSAKFERAVADLSEARTELAELLRSLPSASAMTPAERRRNGPLKLGGGFGHPNRGPLAGRAPDQRLSRSGQRHDRPHRRRA